MATRTVKTKLEIDGEKQYKESVKEINQSLGVLNSEMKKTTAQFQDNTKSVEALKAKGLEPVSPIEDSFFEIERNSFKTIGAFIKQKTE